MPLSFRHTSLSYLRAAVAGSHGAALRHVALATFAFGGLAAAALVPPSSVIPRLAAFESQLGVALFFFCSMLVGSAPYVAAGAVAGAIATLVGRSNAAVPLFALLFPGCDCSMNAYAPALRTAPPGAAGFAIVWGSCCNPLALLATATILGPRMAVGRIVAGAIAATLTALMWSRMPRVTAVHACTGQRDFLASLSSLANSGVRSFAVAAGASALYLAFFARETHRAGGPVMAAALGAMISPCSSADAVLARVLFNSPRSELAFIVAAQCLDLRQTVLVWRSFGIAHAIRALGAASLACAAGCLFASF